MSRLALSARSLAGRFIAGRGAVTTARRSFHSGVVTRISFEESRQATAHCHHSTMWKEWKPLAANGSLLSGEGNWRDGIIGLEKNLEVVQDCLKLCKYLMEVLETMPDSHWKQQTMVSTKFKIAVLESGKSQSEMEEILDFGPLEEVQAVVHGMLEMVQVLGKDWFGSPMSDEEIEAKFGDCGYPGFGRGGLAKDET